MKKRKGPKFKLSLDTSAVNSDPKNLLAQSFSATTSTYKKKNERNSISIDQKGNIEITDNDNEGKKISTPKGGRKVNPENLTYGKELGRGASSYVQLVEEKMDDGTKRKLALKVLNIFDKNMRTQLTDELNSLFAQDCDALVRFYGAFYKEGKISVALEYMDRGSLDGVLKRAPNGKIPEKVLAAITFQCLWGLAYLKHEHRLHRDIKPQNVLLNKRGTVKLTDFGISKELENSIGKAMTIVGTFKYMSPERILGRDYSYGGDIWSLGLMIIECATGKYPFAEANSMIEMAQTVTEAEPPGLTPKDDFSVEFHEFVERCMHKNPDRRETVFELLGYRWLKKNGANSMAKCQAIVKRFFQEEKERSRKLRSESSEYSSGGGTPINSGNTLKSSLSSDMNNKLKISEVQQMNDKKDEVVDKKLLSKK